MPLVEARRRSQDLKRYLVVIDNLRTTSKAQTGKFDSHSEMLIRRLL